MRDALGEWFGPVDAFLRTALALGLYLFFTWLSGEVGWKPGHLVAEGAALMISLIFSALTSRRVWGWPTLHLAWTVNQGQVIEDSSYTIRSGDARRRRVIIHSAIAPAHSLLSWYVFRRMAKGGIRLRVSIVPTGAFRVSDDLTPAPSVFYGQPSGFDFLLADLGKSGTVGRTRVEWEPVPGGLAVRCEIGYLLVPVSKHGRFLSHIVSLKRSVKVVDLTT